MPNGDEDVVGTPGLEDHPLSHVEENTYRHGHWFHSSKGAPPCC